MSNAIDLSVSRSLELLSRVRQIVADFAKREDSLARDLRTRRFAIERKYRDGMAKAESKHGSLISEIEATFKSEEERARATYEGRRTRIQKARATGLKNLPRRAAEAKKRWKGDLQMKHFRAERTLAAGQAAVEKEFAEITQKLAERKATLATLERRARRAVSGYSGFVRALGAPRNVASEAKHNPLERDRLFEDLDVHLGLAGEQLGAVRAFFIPRLFSVLPLAILIVFTVTLALVAGFLLGQAFYVPVGGGAALLLALWCGLYFAGQKQAAPAAAALASVLAEVRWLRKACSVAAQTKHDDDARHLQENYDRTVAEINAQWNRADDIEAEFENAARQKLETQVPTGD